MDQNVRYFLLRRLHSLLGVVPLGIFLLSHLLTNAQGVLGPRAFEEKVKLIHSLGPALPIVEAVFIFIPLALHIVLGVAIALQSRSNVNTLGYARNWAFTLQRASGWVALAFIVYHVLALRFFHDMNAEPFSAVLARQFKNPLWAGVYLLGGVAVIFHFANGLCTFCMSWGITVGKNSQALMAKLATGIGVFLFALLLASIGGFARMDPAEAMRVGKEVHGQGAAAQVAAER